VGEEGVERKLTTILAADVVGYSRLMAADEAGTLAQLKAHRKELIEPKAAAYHGRVVKLIGDGILMEFGSVVDAVTFAVEVQRAMVLRNSDVPEDQRITYRIGINIGDIIVEGDDIYGDGVNVAARLEALANPGGICVARNVHSQVEAKVDLAFKDLGEQEVKNIPKPVQVFKVLLGSSVTDQNVTAASAASRSWRWPVAAGGLAMLVIVAGVAVSQKPWAPHEEPTSEANMAFPLPDKPSIAVLPFHNMSKDESQEYFADGMTEDLITDLSKISGLFVIARNSSFSYKGQKVTVGQVAEELGVRYVLEGSVRRAGDEVRINAQLIDATTGGHLWAERYDGTLDDIFDLQDSVTAQIVAALAVSLTGEEQAERVRHGTENALAHDSYLQGWARYKLLTPEDLKEAVPFFEEAIRLDPNYAQAHAALASLYWDIFKNDWAFDLDMPSARAESQANEHLEQALKSPSPLAHVLQARMFAERTTRRLWPAWQTPLSRPTGPPRGSAISSGPSASTPIIRRAISSSWARSSSGWRTLRRRWRPSNGPLGTTQTTSYHGSISRQVTGIWDGSKMPIMRSKRQMTFEQSWDWVTCHWKGKKDTSAHFRVRSISSASEENRLRSVCVPA
jgi:TolB-like protein/class 3 adenylate cyclase